MSTEILVNVGPRETRGALLENGVLQEVFIERKSRRGIVGNLYKGRVSRVLPGMQAAFVDAGLERTAFLHVDDIALPDQRRDAADVAEEAPRREEPQDIRRLLSAGDDLVVQVVKDPIGTKGARLTTFVSLPSRFLVFMPRGRGIGVCDRTRVVKGKLEVVVAGFDAFKPRRVGCRPVGRLSLRAKTGHPDEQSTGRRRQKAGSVVSSG